MKKNQCRESQITIVTLVYVCFTSSAVRKIAKATHTLTALDHCETDIC